jgi:hypothetical protein
MFYASGIGGMSMLKVKEMVRPKVKLLSSCNENCMYVLGTCQIAWEKAKRSKDEWKKIRQEMFDGDFQHVMETTKQHFDVSF